MLLLIAWRSLWRNKRRTVLTTFAISFGLALGLFFIALGDGQYDKLVDSAVRIEAGHVVVQHGDYLESQNVDRTIAPDTVAAAREALAGDRHVRAIRPIVMYPQGFASSSHGQRPISIYGVDPEVERAMDSPIANAIERGRYLDDDTEAMAVIGSELAEHLEVDLGSKFVLAATDVEGDDVRFLVRVAGVFHSGSKEIDAGVIHIPIGTARSMLNLRPGELHRLTAILDSTESIDHSHALLGAALPAGGTATVLQWGEVMPELWTFMQVDKGGNWVMQAIILGLIFFIIFNTIYMSVMERKREFAVMLALGTPPRRVQAQVLVESFWIGLLSTILGLAIGVGISVYFGDVGIDLTSMMEDGIDISGFAMDPVMRPKVFPQTVLVLGSSVLVLTVLMGLFPAWRATRSALADTLRAGA